MFPSAAWPVVAPSERVLAAGLARLLLVAGIVEVLWLPWPQGVLLPAQRQWALAWLGILSLLVLAAFPLSGRTRAVTDWRRAGLVVTAALAAAATPVAALTGGYASPCDFLYLLPALSLDIRWGRTGAWLIGSTVGICCLLGGGPMAHPPLAPTLGWLEHACVLGGLGVGTFALRASGAQRRATLRTLTALVSAWRAELVALERTRGQLLAHVSHELCTPISAIRASAELLIDAPTLAAGGALEPGGRPDMPVVQAAVRQRLVLNVQRNAQRLALLVDDLLELASLEERRPSLHPAWHSCAMLVAHAAEAVMPLCEGRRQTLAWQVSDDGLRVWADARRVDQVLVNLLANAHKYAGEGAHITVEARAADDGVCLDVRDDGPGLSPGAMSRLFDRYYRCPGTPGQGSGLGLAIAQAQVELHGGRLWAENNEGAGCAFVVWLPGEGGVDMRAGERPLDRTGL